MSRGKDDSVIANQPCLVAGFFDMSTLTAAQLIERLRAVHSERLGYTLVDEKLAGQLPISLRTFNRWKSGSTKQFDQIVAMLDEAGLLNTSADAGETSSKPRDRLAVIEEGVIALLAGQDQLLEKEGLARQSTPNVSRSLSPSARKETVAKGH